MSLADFLQGGHLERADIVLVCGTNLFGRVIRWATNSPFSHAALVFLVADQTDGFERSFVIEAEPKGVSIRGVDYLVAALDNHPQAAVAVLRFAPDWFTPDMRKRVRGRMLEFIQADYDWGAVLRIAWSVTAGRVLGAERIAADFQQGLKTSYAARQLAPGNFICSGLIQYGFLRAVQDFANQYCPVGDVVFDNDLLGHSPQALLDANPAARARLLAITPETLSRSKALQYKYLIHQGQVHAISSRDEVVAALGKGRHP
ncbi:MAG: hypothetical protein KGQ52_11500 [Alphaproteobacteria bacterium]|nr:hypothetical protein [Alphaproteobacteria bacterium]